MKSISATWSSSLWNISCPFLWAPTAQPPYRLDFGDFHPERVLSFLPYQLDYTHLRMIWRRWKKKAHIQVRPFGFRLTPFGPPLVDGMLSRFLRLKGDFVPDFRLLDYLVGVMSTDRSPALDGRLGNEERLKCDLVELGVFDSQMPVYLPYRLREFLRRGSRGSRGVYTASSPDSTGIWPQPWTCRIC